MVRLMALGALAGAVVGLLWALLTMPSHGSPHHCPPGSSVSACFYPVNRAGHLSGWAVAGLLAGLLLATGCGRLLRWRSERLNPDPSDGG